MLGTPLGFALSLGIDYRKSPLKSCLPIRKFCLKPNTTQIPNRVFFEQRGDKPQVFLGRERSKHFWFWLSLGGGIPVILLSNFLAAFILKFFPELPTAQIEAIQEIFERYSGPEVFWIVVLSPVLFEELVYRGRGFALLARTWGSRNAVILTSLIFAISHGSPVEVLSLIPLAFYLGWIRWRSGNLAFAML
ncbi:MAG: CPBP family intramembrane glutamic endopeptidase, partial [Spirochaetota bacterium]